MFEVMRLPRPFCAPPKYSATKAVMTAAGAAIFSAVNRYGTAFGTRALASTSTAMAAYERSSSRWVASTWRSPLATLTSTMKYTISVTISRRGISDVIANMLLNTDTSTMIGIALRATASGVEHSLSSRNRISRKLTATPSTVPSDEPDQGVRARHGAPRPRSGRSCRVNASRSLDGLGRKYGFQSNTLTASSHSGEEGDAEHERRPRRRPTTRPRPIVAHRSSTPTAADRAVVDLVAAQRLAHLGDLLEERGVLAGVDVAVRRRGRRR